MATKNDKKNLISENKSCWEKWDSKQVEQAFSFADDYKKFLNKSKTEKECVISGLEFLKLFGYKNIFETKSIKSGDKVYAINRDKCIITAKIGKNILDKGFKMVMSHIDSPHLDLKVHPLYEDESMAFFKTHYYGGLKKYQWPTITLALHGDVCLASGKKVNIKIGENENEPVFMITDILPHLDRVGGPGTAPKNREVQGEDLNLLIGSIPVKNEKTKEKIKLAILEYLNKAYNITEDDLSSADLQVVPSEKARDIGFDRSLISGHGHDDRACSFAAMQALLTSEQTNETQICYWVNREEIGSEGNTGAQSIFFEIFVSDILKLSGKDHGLDEVYRIFTKSSAISADVTAGVDPDYKDVHDLKNSCHIGHGAAIERYTGSRGKYDTSEASAEYVQKLRMILNKEKIVYQLGGGLGKIDLGGGGTIAKYMANLNMDIVDMGMPVLNMHAPLEIISKADLYSSYLAYRTFLEK